MIRKSKFNQQGFLNIFILIVLIIGIVIGVYLVGQRVGFFSKASQGFPDKVIISNITDSSFTVSWFTPDSPQNQFLSYGESSSLGKTSSDDRDGGELRARYTHHVTLRGLTPVTQYYLKIGADPKSPTFTQKTASSLRGAPKPPETFFGTAKDNKATPEEAIVYLAVENGQLLSTTTKDGKWKLSYAGARTRDLSSYLDLRPSLMTEIYVQSGLYGSGYMNVFAYGKSHSLNLLLNFERIPFFEIKLGGLDFNQFSAKTSDESPQPSPTNPSQNNSSKNFFETIWLFVSGGK